MTYHTFLADLAIPGSWKLTPTIAAADFKVSKDGAAFANLATLPSEEPAGSGQVKISLSATEMDADEVVVRGIDQTAVKEWADHGQSFLTTA